ncbi:hypothetical protein GCM10007164_20580 [Luteimonas padinae]|uniref:ABC transporter permease n=2 Tax=Luteimonas padinae TaxID=1714359 RepID=A0ABV6SXE7_9GAMM|nr:hypothetical protein GCM10007164_20580 [Luteimonas padinae]
MRLREKPFRIIYLVASLIIAVVSWIILHTVAQQFSNAKGVQRDAITVSAERVGQSLPMRYVEQVRHMDGVADVAFMNFLPVLCNAPSTAATLNAWSIPPGRAQALGQSVAPGVMDAWASGESNILVGAQLAQTCGWAEGMTLEPLDLFSQRPVQIHVAGILPQSESGSADHVGFAHYAYVNRLLPPESQDRVLMMRVYGESGVDPSVLANEIERMFATDTQPVEASESAEAESMLSRFGNVSALLWLVMAAVSICALLVFVSTWAHSAAERRASMATLLAMGFQRSQIFFGLAMELALVTLASAVLGAALGQALIHFLDPQVSLYLGRLRTAADSYFMLGGGLLFLVIASAALPARTIARVSPHDRHAL